MRLQKIHNTNKTLYKTNTLMYQGDKLVSMTGQTLLKTTKIQW